MSQSRDTGGLESTALAVKQAVYAKYATKYTLVFVKNDDLVVYAVDKGDVISEGGYGVVYSAYKLDPLSLTINADIRFAAKKFKDIDHIKKKEIEFHRRYYKVCDFGISNNDAYQIMEYLPGDNLFKIFSVTDVNSKVIRHQPKLSGHVNKLNFSDRISLIQNITLAINQMHHETLQTGSALIHSDLSGMNIRVNIKENRHGDYVFDVYLIDFGTANEADDDPDKLNDGADIEGVPCMKPVEVMDFKMGTKTDIYSLSVVFMIVLGSHNPFVFKDEIAGLSRFEFAPKAEYFEAEFSFEGIFADLEMERYEPDIMTPLLLFLLKMQSVDYNARPDSDQVLRFFTTLDNFCKQYQRDSQSDECYVLAAKLIILASGLSKLTFSVSGQPKLSFNLEDVHLSEYVSFCKAVCQQFERINIESLPGLKPQTIMTACLKKEVFIELYTDHEVYIDRPNQTIAGARAALFNQLPASEDADDIELKNMARSK